MTPPGGRVGSRHLSVVSKVPGCEDAAHRSGSSSDRTDASNGLLEAVRPAGGAGRDSVPTTAPEPPRTAAMWPPWTRRDAQGAGRIAVSNPP